MRKVIRYQTSDGIEHKDFDIANRYADNRYGNALISMSHKLVAIHKFKDMVSFLETNLTEFVKIQKLKDDIPLVKDDEDDE